MAPVKGSTTSNNGLVPSLITLVRALLFERRWYWHFVSLLLLGEAALGVLIIWKIPYTKIDWDAYMQQVEGFLGGQRDYSKLEGETGPLVYPALHLYIYTAFYKLLPSLNRIRPAQIFYLALYLFNILLTATIYYLAGRSSTPSSAPKSPQSGSPLQVGRHVPQILLIPLALSKREHSIYMLRLFNDPLSMTLLYTSVIAMMLGGRPGWRLASVLYSLALGIKMNILLFLPALLVLLSQFRGVFGVSESITIIALVQLVLPSPFFIYPLDNLQTYFSSAFDFSRDFLYEWTVNWRFLPPKTFHSRDFAVQLLVTHAAILIAFGWARWSPVPGSSFAVLKRGLASPSRASLASNQLQASHIPLILFTSNLIGMICARSLHYQFHSWYFNQLPFLLYFGGAWGSPYLGAVLWLALEWTWSLAKVTPLSSSVMLTCHLIVLAGIWQNGPKPPTRRVGLKTV